MRPGDSPTEFLNSLLSTERPTHQKAAARETAELKTLIRNKAIARFLFTTSSLRAAIFMRARSLRGG
jgi:hypothetical protein